MTQPPIVANDAARVDRLRSLGVLDTPPDPDYDEITQLAAEICEVPIALISLVDADRQWFKSRVGLPMEGTSRSDSLCAHVISEPDRDVFLVPDAQLDSRFADNPLVVAEPKLRFYAGSPLVTHDGLALGTLCVMDRQPRQLSALQLRALAALRRNVVNVLELRRVVTSQNRTIVDLESTRSALELSRRNAEGLTRAKAEFLANMSHEIRTPMNAVIGMTSLLRATSLTLEQKECVDTIHGSGEHLLTVINEILDFSKIESGKLILEAASFELRECVSIAVSLLAMSAAEKKITLDVAFDAAAPVMVLGDATRLRQILVNLLSNAVKFTSHGGVSLRVRSRELPGGDSELEFNVQDTGIGIPPERIDRLFQQFSQVDASTTRRFGGTGLGLVISKHLAELHGGRMWVESEAGRGSCFNFTFVVRPGSATAKPGTAPPFTDRFDAGFAGRYPARVLVAEDNAVNQLVILRTLQKLGYAPKVVSDGLEAVAALRLADFDVILMDVEMPGLDGPGATRALRKEFPENRQPVVIALTAHALAGSREQFLEAGMDGYLAKPIRFGELATLLSQRHQLRRAH